MKVLCIGGDHIDRRLQVGQPLVLGQSVPVVSEEQRGGVAANIARALIQVGVQAETLSMGAACSYTVIEDQQGTVLYGLASMDAYDGMDDAWLSGHQLGADALVIDANTALNRKPDFDGPIYLAGVSPAKMLRLAPLLPYAAGLFCNGEEWAQLTGPWPDFTLVTNGARGAVLRGGENLPPLPRPPKTENGLGDALAGYCIAALLRGKEPAAAARWAMEKLTDEYC